MQGQNPYSPYLPANNPSMFGGKKKDDTLSKVLGYGGTAVGGIIGGIYGGPAGASAGMSIGGMAGGGLDSLIQGEDGADAAAGTSQLASAGASAAKWYQEEEAKSSAAAILESMGGV